MNLQFTNNVAAAIDAFVATLKPASVFVHVDSNTAKFVLPVLQSQSTAVQGATIITSAAGDINKNIDAVTRIWDALSKARATRHSLLINVGGGVVTDMGGFAAATFKRGMSLLNVPTTLLGAVDASVGGKTGINFNGYKNQVGAFYQADMTIISTTFFDTLTPNDMLSGYAEMIKHALLKSTVAFNAVINYDITEATADFDAMLHLLQHNVLIKKKIVDDDPTEQGPRKALNLGHTAGHAIEAFAMNQRHNPVSHGFAVAQGLVIEAILSHLICGFDSALLHTLAAYVRKNYPPIMLTCDDYPQLLDYMRQDKKNDNAGDINFTLLAAPGEIRLDNIVDDKTIAAALDIYRDLTGL